MVLTCFAVGIVSPSLGTSCGVNFAVMANFLPPAAVVPLHGVLEGFSSAVRWSLLQEFTGYRFLVAFTVGSGLGFIAGWPLIGRFSDNELRLLLGGFFLMSVWIPLGWMRLSASLGGAVTSSLSLLVGATGPLVAALIARSEQDHRVVIATQGACTVLQHWGKVILFAVSGFSFASYIELIVVLCVATLFGSWLGKRVVLRLPQKMLKLALKAVVSMLGLKLLLDGLEIKISSVPIGSWTGVIVIAAMLSLVCFVAYQIGADAACVRTRKEKELKSHRLTTQ